MSFIAAVDRYFLISKQGSSIQQELRAGLTTFLTMSYILFVNPLILGEAITLPGGDTFPKLMAATALAAAFGSLLMGVLSKYPFALAPGMGLNAYFAYSVVLGQNIDWRVALGAVFISGCLFLIISLIGVRQMLINAIPRGLKYATTAGIGCFLATLGLKNGGIMVDHPVTLVTMGDMARPEVLIMLFGLILTVVLMVLKIKGAILFGIFGASLTAILSKAPVFAGKPFAGLEHGLIKAPIMPGELLFALDIPGALGLGVLTVVFTFLFVDFFDSAGTLIALSEKVGGLDGQGNMQHARGAFAADAAATVVGACLGTSSTTSYIESAAGVEDGGKTGLTSVTVAGLFLLSLFIWPLVACVPAVAAAPALVVIGSMMMFTTLRINWSDHGESVPALLIILGMPLTFSITNGLSLGLIAYCLIHLISGRIKNIHPLMYVLTGLLIVRLLFLGGS